MPKDQLKEKVAAAALNGATGQIFLAVEQDYDVEVVTRERLEWQLRLRSKNPAEASRGPRYFVVKVSEPI